MLFFFFFLAPTVPPTLPVPPTTPSDECDDDANCHSGTGDDYEHTGANSRACALPYYTFQTNSKYLSTFESYTYLYLHILAKLIPQSMG